MGLTIKPSFKGRGAEGLRGGGCVKRGDVSCTSSFVSS
jgi:hypothetical protein